MSHVQSQHTTLLGLWLIIRRTGALLSAIDYVTPVSGAFVLVRSGGRCSRTHFHH